MNTKALGSTILLLAPSLSLLAACEGVSSPGALGAATQSEANSEGVAPKGEDLLGPTGGFAPGSLRLVPGTNFHVQLQGTLVEKNVKVFDIDLYDTPRTKIADLKSRGRIVMCYFSAGTAENWRTDYSSIPPAAIGNALEGWEGENWLDTRNAAVRSVMLRRLDLAKSKGCQGVDPDNMDAYTYTTGFPLTKETQIDYARFLAREAHARGLSIGLKNATDLVADLVNDFDWSIHEECSQYRECHRYSPFIQKQKAVFQIEYTPVNTTLCSQARSLGFSLIFATYALNGAVRYCPAFVDEQEIPSKEGALTMQ